MKRCHLLRPFGSSNESQAESISVAEIAEGGGAALESVGEDDFYDSLQQYLGVEGNDDNIQEDLLAYSATQAEERSVKGAAALAAGGGGGATTTTNTKFMDLKEHEKRLDDLETRLRSLGVRVS